MFRVLSLLLSLMATLIQAQEDLITIPQSLLDQVDNGHAESAYFIATQFDKQSQNKESYNKESYKKAKKWMKKSAEMGYPQAMYELAQMFDYEELENKAFDWYLKASDYGHADAIYSIASIYIQGKADEASDCIQAYQWYKKAEAKESIIAYNDHAWSLATSARSECKNPEKALRVFSNVVSYYKLNDESMPTAYIDTQAAVHAAIADFNTAIRLQQSAVDSMTKNDPNRGDYLERLESYKNRKVWVQVK